jgi:hypothetical protein
MTELLRDLYSKSGLATIGDVPTQIPLVHMNGTSAEVMTRELEEAYSKINEAYEALRQTTPNMRDYYPYPDPQAAFKRATAQHLDRMTLMDKANASIERLLEGIQAQADVAEAIRGN